MCGSNFITVFASCIWSIKLNRATERTFIISCLSLHTQVEKVLTVAEDLKNIGNTLFKNQDWKAAIKKYGKALR